VIRGDTPHFDYVAGEASRGLAQASAEFDTPIGFGLLTCDNQEQAEARAGGAHGTRAGTPRSPRSRWSTCSIGWMPRTRVETRARARVLQGLYAWDLRADEPLERVTSQIWDDLAVSADERRVAGPAHPPTLATA
jgi:hypothetical protein